MSSWSPQVLVGQDTVAKVYPSPTPLFVANSARSSARPSAVPSSQQHHFHGFAHPGHGFPFVGTFQYGDPQPQHPNVSRAGRHTQPTGSPGVQSDDNGVAYFTSNPTLTVHGTTAGTESHPVLRNEGENFNVNSYMITNNVPIPNARSAPSRPTRSSASRPEFQAPQQLNGRAAYFTSSPTLNINGTTGGSGGLPLVLKGENFCVNNSTITNNGPVPNASSPRPSTGSSTSRPDSRAPQQLDGKVAYFTSSPTLNITGTTGRPGDQPLVIEGKNFSVNNSTTVNNGRS